MNRLIYLAIAIVALVTPASVAVGNAAGKQQVLSLIHGEYMGEIFNGTDLDAVLTSFYRGDKGETVGAYVIDDSGNMTVGILRNVRSESRHSATANWKDKYGTGFMRILFSSDFVKFSGYWGSVEHDARYVWSGSVKNEDATSASNQRTKRMYDELLDN